MKLVRGALLLVGGGVLGVLWVAESALSRHDRATADEPAGIHPTLATPAPPVPPVPTSVTRVRVLLGAVGVGIAVFGLYVMLRDVAPASYLGLAVWLVAAIVLHDFVYVPVLTVLRAGAHRAGRRLPLPAVRLLEAGFLVGGAITIIAAPEIYAKHLGTLNATVLPGSYGSALLVTWGALAVVTALAAVAVTLTTRRRVLLAARLPAR